jgi:Ni,Fe-hydrogenase III small subunit
MKGIHTCGVKKSAVFSGKSIISCITDFMVPLDVRIPGVPKKSGHLPDGVFFPVFIHFVLNAMRKPAERVECQSPFSYRERCVKPAL